MESTNSSHCPANLYPTRLGGQPSRAIIVQRGSGSGLIWDELGHVVTNKLDRYRAGDAVNVRIWRSGRELELPIALTANR